MGSGYSRRYSGTIERSQPFSARGYHVEKPMLEHDKDSGTYLNDLGYRPNPTATDIDNSIINNKIYIQGRIANGQFTYVVDSSSNLIIGRRNGSEEFQTPHPSLIGGKDPVSKMAGMVDIRNGKIYSWDDRSGHFKPNKKSMKYADEAFGKLPKELFAKNSKRGNN